MQPRGSNFVIPGAIVDAKHNDPNIFQMRVKGWLVKQELIWGFILQRGGWGSY